MNELSVYMVWKKSNGIDVVWRRTALSGQQINPKSIYLKPPPQIELHNILCRPIGGLHKWIWEVAARVSIDSTPSLPSQILLPPVKKKKGLQTFD